jgi:ribulose-5-phosphate 4-epimerase/fuculose-1-phosphate aldolase
MAMSLRNHGLLAVGRSIPEAFNRIYFLERACQAQVQAMAGGRPTTIAVKQVDVHPSLQAEFKACPDFS